MNKAAEEALKAAREASAYFEKFDKSNLYHAWAHRKNDWFLDDLSENGNHSKMMVGLEPPNADRRYLVLVPQSSTKTLTLQEVHQVIRELVEGIYVFQQVPSAIIEPNHDCSSVCSISSAYHDTMIGRSLFAVCYFIVSLLHGTTVPHKEKRAKLSEAWRKTPAENLRSLFITEGMERMEDDPELGSGLYHQKKEPFYRYPMLGVDRELAKQELRPRLSTGDEYEQRLNHVSLDFFLRCSHNVNIGVVLTLSGVNQSGPVLMFQAGMDATTSIVDVKEESRDLLVYLHTYLQKQRDFISENMQKHTELLHHLDILNLVSFLIPFLATLRETNKVVDISQLRPPISKDHLRTNRELPPLFPTESSRWSPYVSENGHDAMCSFVAFHQQPHRVEQSKHDFTDLITSLTNNPTASTTDMATYTLNNKTYHCLVITVEDYYSNSPKIPRWLHAMVAELKVQCSRLSTITDSRIQDFLRKPLGPRQASKLKTPNATLPASVKRGILPSVVALIKRSTKTRLNKVDENGWALVHYASSNCRTEVLTALLMAGCNVNHPCQTGNQLDTRMLPIHLAARSGGLDTVCCLLKYGASLNEEDDLGWLPLHHAAFHNYHNILSHLVSILPSSIETTTADKEGATPLLLAAANGGFDTVKVLVQLGANLVAKTKSDSTIVHLAVLNHHINILKYILTLNPPELAGWEILISMLAMDPLSRACEAAIRILDPITRWQPVHTHLLQHKAMPIIVGLLKQANEKLQHLAVQVVANISNITEVGRAVVDADGIPPLVSLLKSTNERIQSCSCLVLCDLGRTPENQITIVKLGAASSLVSLLTSESDDVQLFASACLCTLATGNIDNQTVIGDNGAIEGLYSLLASPLSCIQACSASALQAIVTRHAANQLKALSVDILSKLLVLLQSRESSVHCNAADAIEAAANGNEECQRVYRGNRTCITLLIRLLRMRDSRVKIGAGCALWAIAGPLISNQHFIATEIGMDLLIDMLSLHNEKLDYVCGHALTALITEVGADNQQKCIGLGGVRLLVDVLTPATSQGVLLAILQTLSSLATKPALAPNPPLQEAIAGARGIPRLVAIITAETGDSLVRVEAACTLAKVVLNNAINEAYLVANTEFTFLRVFEFLDSKELVVQLKAGYCLAIMAFNNNAQLNCFKAHQTLDVSRFQLFLQSDDDSFKAHAAFQLVVLAKLINGARNVELQVAGIKLLVRLCSSQQEHIKILTAELLATLAHSRSGIPDTLVMTGAIDPIILNTQSPSKPVVEASCIALGYLTFNLTASRILASTFRDNPELYEIFNTYISSIVVSSKFLETWNDIKQAGIPSLSLEGKGGPPVKQGWKLSRTCSQASSSVPLAKALPVKPSQMTIQSHQSNCGLLAKRKLSLPKIGKTPLVQNRSFN